MVNPYKSIMRQIYYPRFIIWKLGSNKNKHLAQDHMGNNQQRQDGNQVCLAPKASVLLDLQVSEDSRPLLPEYRPGPLGFGLQSISWQSLLISCPSVALSAVQSSPGPRAWLRIHLCQLVLFTARSSLSLSCPHSYVAYWHLLYSPSPPGIPLLRNALHSLLHLFSQNQINPHKDHPSPWHQSTQPRSNAPPSPTQDVYYFHFIGRKTCTC